MSEVIISGGEVLTLQIARVLTCPASGDVVVGGTAGGPASRASGEMPCCCALLPDVDLGSRRPAGPGVTPPKVLTNAILTLPV
jgi:hypothetical protein